MSKKSRQVEQLRRLESFSHQVRDHYEEKQIGDKWYVKNYNRNTDKWQVAIYSLDSFRRYKTFQS